MEWAKVHQNPVGWFVSKAIKPRIIIYISESAFVKKIPYPFKQLPTHLNNLAKLAFILLF